MPTLKQWIQISGLSLAGLVGATYVLIRANSGNEIKDFVRCYDSGGIEIYVNRDASKVKILEKGIWQTKDLLFSVNHPVRCSREITPDQLNLESFTFDPSPFKGQTTYDNWEHMGQGPIMKEAEHNGRNIWRSCVRYLGKEL